MITILKAPARLLDWLAPRGSATIPEMCDAQRKSGSTITEHLQALQRAGLVVRVSEKMGNQPAVYAAVRPAPIYAVGPRVRVGKCPRKAVQQQARRVAQREAEIEQAEIPVVRPWRGVGEWRIDRLPAGPPSIFHAADYGLRCHLPRRA